MTKLDYEILEPTNSKQLMSLLNTSYNIVMIICDIQLQKEDGLAVLKDIRKNASDIPIIVLTAENRKHFFVQSMRLGASDYILKPFDDEYLLSRIQDIIITSQLNLLRAKKDEVKLDSMTINLNFEEYLEKEIFKGIKGNYPITILVTLFVEKSRRASHNTTRTKLLLNEIYSDFCKQIFSTDVLIKYGHMSLIGVFPFSDATSSHLILSKIESVYQQYVEKNNLEDVIEMKNGFVFFPNEGQDYPTLMALVNQHLADRLIH